MSFEPRDLVRIRHLAVADREVDGPSARPPRPRLGELGTIVDVLGDGLFLVEHITDDGLSLWTAEFHHSELALVERPGD